MTAYFDEKHQRLASFADRVNQEDYSVGKDLDNLEMEVVRDVSICSAMPGFPPELARRIDEVILKRGVGSLPINASPPSFDTVVEHAALLDRLFWGLHTVFHDVAQAQIDGFSDDPRAPLRCFFSTAEERRENLVEALKSKDQ